MKHHFFYSPEGKLYLIENYVNGNQSAYSLAKEHGTYPNVFYRALKKHGLPRRSKSEAQKNGLENNRAIHPTEGKERTMSEKRAIGWGMHAYWHGLHEDILEKRIAKCRDLWYSIPEETRKAWTYKSHLKLKEAARNGSKLEKYILAALLASGFKVQAHRKFLFENSEMSIDIFLVMEGICIEIDGPSHFLPIWGDEALEKTVERDLIKNEQLMTEGYSVIRLQNEKGLHSKTIMEKVAIDLIRLVKKVALEPTNVFLELLMSEL